MLNWLKAMFNPKAILKQAIDALDLAVPFLATEIDKIENRFKDMNPINKAQWIVDKVQEFLRKQFKLDA